MLRVNTAHPCFRVVAKSRASFNALRRWSLAEERYVKSLMSPNMAKGDLAAAILLIPKMYELNRRVG
jgi:hypothetical protein